MGGVPVKHHSKGKVGRRRSHLALKKGSFLVCPTCKAPKLPHRTCVQCGNYAKKDRESQAIQPVENQVAEEITSKEKPPEIADAKEPSEDEPEEQDTAEGDSGDDGGGSQTEEDKGDAKEASEPKGDKKKES